jgi:hypothetical protein
LATRVQPVQQAILSGLVRFRRVPGRVTGRTHSSAAPAMTSRSGMKVIPFRRKILYEQRSREQIAVNNTEETRELA